MTPPGDPPDLLALPTGARVLEFEIERVVGRGGFSIVYLAFDHSLHRRVALKEYLPQTLARRDATQSVVPFSAKHRETFDIGLKSFLEEARLLARFDHPGLVKVFRFWPASGTAYMAMAYYEGPTLREAFVHSGTRPSVPTAEALASRLVDAVELLHRNECLHRDIAPDNVILQPNGNPVLLDFGAARRIIKERTQALTVILKTGYAPIEQYSVEGEMVQGPWTDVYSLAATLYAVITGKGPPPSVRRAYSDPYVPFALAAPAGYPAQFADGIDRALSFLPEKRPQSMAEFRDALGLGTRATPARAADDVTVRMPREPAKDETTVAVAPAPRPAAPLEAAVPAQTAPAHEDAATVAVPRARARRDHRRARSAALAACAVLAVCAVVVFALRDRIWPAAGLPVAANDPASPGSPASPAPPAPRPVEADPRVPPRVVQALPPPRDPPRDAKAATPAPAQAKDPPPAPAVEPPAPKPAAPASPAAPAAAKPAPSLIPEPAPASPTVVAKADVAPRTLPSTTPETTARTESGDPADTFRTTLRGAEAGDARAQAALGWAYQNGLGVGVDYAAARKWYEAAAAQGNAAAQNNLGNLHLSGLGVARNYVVAAQWYRKSADQGYALAQNNLALLLENGRGTFRDPAGAAELYRRAAEGGNANAMYNLGRLYDTGNGVAKDRAEAQKWFQAAAEKGQKSAIAKLAELEGK